MKKKDEKVESSEVKATFNGIEMEVKSDFYDRIIQELFPKLFPEKPIEYYWKHWKNMVLKRNGKYVYRGFVEVREGDDYQLFYDECLLNTIKNVAKKLSYAPIFKQAVSLSLLNNEVWEVINSSDEKLGIEKKIIDFCLGKDSEELRRGLGHERWVYMVPARRKLNTFSIQEKDQLLAVGAKKAEKKNQHAILL